MVRIDAVTDDDFLEYNEIFKMADGLFGWTREDSYKVILEDKVYMLFGFHPIFMLFGYDKHGKLVNKSCVVNEEGKVVTKTNNCGGILGGISSGMPLTFKAAFKPTPSVAIAQDSVDVTKNEEAILEIKGRHDPCIVPRAAAVIEAVTAIALVNADGFCV